jgi:hypothetical protein
LKVILLSLAILLFKLSFGQSPGFKIFLIGDTGEDIALESTMKNFLDTISLSPNSATVFLGDNCYKGFRKGFDSSDVTIKRLGAQLTGLNTSKYEGSVYFVPGNHDWWNVTNMKKGKRHLKTEQTFIETNLNQNQFIRNKDNPFMPKNGNPVAHIDLNDDELKLIFIDTHWLIIQKNEDEKSKAYLLLDSILNQAISRHQKILIAAHHPIFTIGKHSKKRSWQFPKSLKDQDIYHPLYQDMRTRIEKMLSQKKYPITYTSGHDHVLGYFYKDSVQYLVSGAGSKSSRYNHRKNQDSNPTPGEDVPGSQFAKVREGFFEIDYTTGDVRIKAIYYDENKAHSVLIR